MGHHTDLKIEDIFSNWKEHKFVVVDSGTSGLTQIGTPLQDWMYVGEGVFEFREEKMLTAFLLKWS